MEDQLTATRATGVLNAAMKHNMLAGGAIPESDADKVTEAEKIVALARQADAVAQQIGPANVPNYDAIKDVLFEANVVPAAGAEHAAVAPPQPAPAEPIAAAVPSLPAPPEPAVAALPPAAPTPAPAPVLASTDPAKNERWLDASGGEWDIIAASGGPQIEARAVATGEVTVLPAGFLTQRAPVAMAAVDPVPPPPPAPVEQPAAVPTPTELPQQPPAPPTVEPPPAAPPVPPPSSPQEPVASQPDPGERAQGQQLTVPLDDDEGDEKYGALLAQVTADYNPAGMPTPMDLERPPAAMPEDLTGVSDIEARALHSQFNALASRARYLHGLEEAKRRACARVYAHHLKGAMRVARGELGKDASVTEVTQLAEDNVAVDNWVRRRDRHGDRAEAYKTFLSFYIEDVSVLSRDWTMRDREERGS